MKNIRVHSARKEYRKLSGRAAACILVVSLLLRTISIQALAAGDGKEEKTGPEPFYIHNVQELLEFAENCRVSDYSAGRAVYLMQDLDLDEIEEFEGIASFSGTFFGNRCTVSGVHLKKGSESIGFFRYLEEGAVVRDLTVCCETQNDDGGKILGGIAGVNGGTIKNCSFSGKLTGAGVTGGIAGLNGSRAGILQCSSEGEVSGIHMVGGIAGENTGVISDCTNGADVNAAEDWLELEERKEKERNLAGMVDTVQEKMDRGSDFGGICGYSSGIIAGCRNSATVGYQHAGRNVGGIVGRQSGKVILSVNDGKVYGKQDVGGIAGQFEPYTVYEDVEELDQKVGELHDLMAQMIDDMEAMGDDLHGDFQGLNRESREAGDTADVLMDEMRDVIKKNVDIVNQLAQRIDYAMNHFAVVTDHLNKALGSADRMLGDLDQVKTDLDLPGQMSGEAYDAARDRRLVIQSSAGGILTADNPSPSEGARVVFTMTAEPGYRLAKLLRTPYGKETLDETEKVQDNKYIIDSMPAENQTVTALFEYVGGEYIVESNAGGKAVLTPDQTQLTIMPAAGYAAESVRIDGGENVLSEGADTVSLSREECGHPRRIFVQFRKMEEPQPVIFDENVARVSAVSGVGGTVSCDQSVIKAGETIRIMVADDPHYVLSSLTVGGSDNLAAPAENHVIEYTPEELSGGDVEICAQFRPVTVIAKSSQAGGRAYYATDGQDVIITVSEDTGYRLEELRLTDAYGREIPCSRKQADSQIYCFREQETGGREAYLDLAFKRQSDRETLDNAKENMKNQSDHLVEGVDGISAVSGQIRDLMTDGEGNTKKPEDLSDEDVEALAGLMRQLMNYVSDTGVAAGEMAGDAGTIARVTTPYTKEAAENAGEDLDRLSEDAHRMNASLQAAGKELQGIINYLNALDRLQAVSLSSNFDKNADQLKLRLDNISDLLDQLDEHTYVHSEKLEDDMRALNDKMNEILHLMVQKLERLENFVNGEDVIEDHSALDSESREAAGITDCTNEGIVNADSNAGGIAGSIGVERADTEDGKRFSVGNKYIARAVLEGCVNKGFITVKNEKAGGIVGNAELGYLKNCTAAGRVRSEEGSYLGGIAGVCSGRIESCGAAAVLMGKAYIGGIAGQAKEIYRCCAIPEILKAEDYVGAIAGKEKESGEDLTVMRTTLCEEIKDNYYVSSEYYGINGVSYVRAAEPVTYEKLLEKAADSSIFQHLYVTFIDADEKIIQKREMEYGADLQYLQYPDVYTPDGDYMEWEGFSGKRMEGNIVIQAVSTSNVTILSGKNGQGSKPIALAAGVFTEAAQIRVSEYQGELPAEEEPGEVCHAYRITLENTDLDKDSVSRIRLLREEPGKAVIYRMEQGEWVKTESKSLGSYEEVEMKGTIGIYCIVTNTRDKSLIPVIGISLTGAFAAVLFFRLVYKTKRKYH